MQEKQKRASISAKALLANERASEQPPSAKGGGGDGQPAIIHSVPLDDPFRYWISDGLVVPP